MSVMIIMSGVSGSGKSSCALKHQGLDLTNVKICSADNYFVDEDTGEYVFDPSQLGRAHRACQGWARAAMLRKHTLRKHERLQ